MTPHKDTLNLIRTSFPGHDTVIERAFNDNRSFRDLCEDYRRCVVALHRWRQANAKAVAPRGEEYTELLVDLGREIQTWLEAMEVGSPPSPGKAR